VHLTTDMFIAQEGFEEKVYYFAHNLHDHAQAAASNVMNQNSKSQQTTFLERCVHYDTLTVDSIDQIAEIAKKLGMKNLRDINKAADTLAVKDKDDANATKRMTYGIYFYHEEMPAASADAKLAPNLDK
jgi:glutathione synthase/RimK-type ligase-like ATP-grasp enzyme